MDQPQGEKTEQPQATPGMTVSGGGNKNAKNVAVNSDGKREWSHGLFDCFADCSTCCFASFLPSMMYSRVKHRIEYLDANGRPEPNGGGTGFDGDCLKHYCCTHLLYCGFILQMSNREAIRQRYNIEGGTSGDCLTTFFCTPCELTQESRELELEELSLMQ